MKLNIKLMPPYRKKGEPFEHTLQLNGESIDLRQLAFYLNREWRERFNYPLIDAKNLLTAEFMVNGRHASLEHVLKDGDRVTVIPYICGG